MFEIAVYAALLMLCALLALLLVLQRQSQAQASAQSWRLGHAHGQAQAKALYAQKMARMTAYEQLLHGQQGGVGKQLADTREVAELIHRHAPGLLRESQGLAPLLQGHGEFLGQLLDAYVAADQDTGGAQSRAAARKPGGIYADLFETAGLPAPGAVIGKCFVIALEAGIVVIRATGQQGCIGRLRLARRDLERFFNDLATKPRSLAAEHAAAVTCRGLYRVDVDDDARKNQLVIEVTSPSSGHLYFGSPGLEQEALRELRSLKRPTLKLLEDEAASKTRRTAAQRARILRRDALLGHVPDDGLCTACEGDVTLRLRLGDKPMGCPLCGTPWSD
ncbi:hypothetical protein ACG02S_04450 [Roseateles sp. DC23W]|uniref:Uncharacterized protein n=1 Tax=Pelomonas dachongensis TaxID=3299029 RepID=A0ABW7EI54_9BURK